MAPLAINNMGLFKRPIFEVSFKDSLVKTGLPIVTFKCNNLDLNFILDTGAMTSLINESCLDVIDNKIFIAGDNIVRGMDPTIEYKAQKCRISMSIAGDLVDAEFCVMNLDETFCDFKEECNVTIHGILGSDFLLQQKYILDYKNMTIYKYNE